MTKDEVLKLALEALENSQNFVEASANAKLKDGWGEQLDEADKAITAIKKALAQPEQEPMAWCAQSELDWLNSDKRGASAYVKTTLSKRRDGLAQTALYTAPTQLEEHNFCPRCGKRNKDIHTCTPPHE